ncbi:DASH complex, subunit Spc34 [Cordyceps fumosorosea ARSEF 2679]|uniref:DASH complex subunit SPC34 n=1 Tax=Cordyceps fumosorosea (strain ARSEF 2679) TaxID=1081104 RepID=A0A168CPM9_CORFA|nr:DASH complex, subunit Spc34 [Cordyceps fumosorosea ARSEF 2679]OAA71636.1 DASH complex, subunit Spc34 [Cordyceps fumosorosea ARSEF 2679]
MSHLGSHLEQISYSCQGIDSLPFPPPKIFANALLSQQHDITSLIRDTEAHERALFSVPPPPPPPVNHAKRGAAASEHDDDKPKPAKRRQTVFNVTAGGDVTTGAPSTSRVQQQQQQQPRKHTAVAAVLGGDMHERLRRGASGGGEVDVEVLLRGAETLCGVYELPGARERIASLRAKYRNGRDTARYYEGKVAEQAAQLASLSREWQGEGEAVEEEEEEDWREAWMEEDLKREEEEAWEMERKKRELQARLQAMEQDLGGLRRM